MRHAFATAVTVVVLSAPVTAQAPAVRWSAAACHTRTSYAEGKEARATVLAGGRVHAEVIDSATDRVLGEATVDGPHWRTHAGADCEAMGVASAEVIARHGAYSVRVELSVGDMCDRAAPRCAVVPVRAP